MRKKFLYKQNQALVSNCARTCNLFSHTCVIWFSFEQVSIHYFYCLVGSPFPRYIETIVCVCVFVYKLYKFAFFFEFGCRHRCWGQSRERERDKISGPAVLLLLFSSALFWPMFTRIRFSLSLSLSCLILR